MRLARLSTEVGVCSGCEPLVFALERITARRHQSFNNGELPASDASSLQCWGRALGMKFARSILNRCGGRSPNWRTFKLIGLHLNTMD